MNVLKGTIGCMVALVGALLVAGVVLRILMERMV
jgi:hypothetical protein